MDTVRNTVKASQHDLHRVDWDVKPQSINHFMSINHPCVGSHMGSIISSVTKHPGH